MKYLNIFKSLLVTTFVAIAGAATAQVSHPLSFPPTASTSSNFYKDYVGVRFEVTAPSSISGPKIYTVANDGSGATSMWGSAPLPMIDSQVIIGPMSDTNGCSAYPSGYFAGKIALVWRGNCEFGAKALAAQNAGAVAVVIVNNVSGGPVGMAAGVSGGSVTIPVYMISLEDGTDIVNQLNIGVTVKMTILLTWLSGYTHDLGFVPEGYSISANNAIPRTQLNTHNAAYKQIDGGYVANFGTADETGVKLQANLSYTPTGGSTTLIHSDSVTLPGTFHQTDSIYAMFAPEYDLPTVTTNGRFDLTYNISSDNADGFLGDNSVTYSFYTTDSLYSKGRYDFAHNRPYCALYTGPGNSNPYIWSVPYFIANGGDAFDSVAFSVSTGPGLLGGLQNIYVFKWADGSGSSAADSFIENDELTLVGLGTYAYNGTTDSSFGFYKVKITGDTSDATNVIPVLTESNTWYLVGAEVPGGTALGLDGVVDGYPRAYGRGHFNNYMEFYNPIWFGDRGTTSGISMYDNPVSPFYPWAFDGTLSYYLDSVVYDNQKGLIPALPFTTTSHFSSGVKNTPDNSMNVEMFPNPAKDYINVKMALTAPAKTVMYTVIDNGARVISKETRNNVQNDLFSFSTATLPAGNYYMIINADEKHIFKKFTVVK